MPGVVALPYLSYDKENIAHRRMQAKQAQSASCGPDPASDPAD
jgi:hypothetical protein